MDKNRYNTKVRQAMSDKYKETSNVFIKNCDEFLNYINNIKPDIIDMYGGNTYNNLVNEAVEME